MRLNVKELVREFKNCDSNWDQMDLMGSNINQISDLLLTKPSYEVEEKDRLKRFLWDRRTAKVIYDVVESNQYDVKLGIVVALGRLLGEVTEIPDGDAFMYYKKVIDEYIKGKARVISKQVEVPEVTVKNLLIECPAPIDELDRDGVIYSYITSILNKLYIICKMPNNGITNDNIYDLIESIIGKNHLVRFVINVLLEKNKRLNYMQGNQIDMWNLLTNFALDYLSSGNPRDIEKVLVSLYVRRRAVEDAQGRDDERRISFIDNKFERYPKIKRVVDNILDNERYDNDVIKYLK